MDCRDIVSCGTLASFLLTAASIALVALVFHTQVIFWRLVPLEALSILQRVISSLSVTVTSAVILVAGKRYVLFKLARGGLRSRRVAVYSNPSIGALVSYLVSRGAELPLLALSGIWVLGLVTSLTVNSSWERGPHSSSTYFFMSFGPFYPTIPGFSWVVPASAQLGFVISSICLGLDRNVGLINVTSIRTDHPLGVVYYPPLRYSVQNSAFSFSTAVNGFDTSIEALSTVPPTARSLACLNATSGESPEFKLWFESSDNQSLSIIASQLLSYDTNPPVTPGIYRFNATAVIMGGTLTSNGNYTEFSRNGTSWPNVMSRGGQWAQDITSLICNTTLSPVGSCFDSTFLGFASTQNGVRNFLDEDAFYSVLSTALNMAIGAYSSANPDIQHDIRAPITRYNVKFTSRYGIYVLILHTVVSLILLVVVVKLRLASRLNADFINPTRLLLDSLKKPELFNTSLETTLDALKDPYMIVREDEEFLVAERKAATQKERKRVGRFTLLNSFDRTPK